MTDDLDLLRRHRGEPEPPSDEIRAAARLSLERAIRRQTLGRRREPQGNEVATTFARRRDDRTCLSRCRDCRYSVRSLEPDHRTRACGGAFAPEARARRGSSAAHGSRPRPVPVHDVALAHGVGHRAAGRRLLSVPGSAVPPELDRGQRRGRVSGDQWTRPLPLGARIRCVCCGPATTRRHERHVGGAGMPIDLSDSTRAPSERPGAAARAAAHRQGGGRAAWTGGGIRAGWRPVA